MQEGTESIDVCWKRVRALRQQLAAVGETISYQDMVIVINFKRVGHWIQLLPISHSCKTNSYRSYWAEIYYLKKEMILTLLLCSLLWWLRNLLVQMLRIVLLVHNFLVSRTVVVIWIGIGVQTGTWTWTWSFESWMRMEREDGRGNDEECRKPKLGKKNQIWAIFRAHFFQFHQHSFTSAHPSFLLCTSPRS